MAIYTICAKVTSPKAKVFWSNKMLFQVKYHILCFLQLIQLTNNMSTSDFVLLGFATWSVEFGLITV